MHRIRPHCRQGVINLQLAIKIHHSVTVRYTKTRVSQIIERCGIGLETVLATIIAVITYIKAATFQLLKRAAFPHIGAVHGARPKAGSIFSKPSSLTIDRVLASAIRYVAAGGTVTLQITWPHRGLFRFEKSEIKLV